jgi:hypothetical protein
MPRTTRNTRPLFCELDPAVFEALDAYRAQLEGHPSRRAALEEILRAALEPAGFLEPVPPPKAPEGPFAPSPRELFAPRLAPEIAALPERFAWVLDVAALDGLAGSTRRTLLGKIQRAGFAQERVEGELRVGPVNRTHPAVPELIEPLVRYGARVEAA